jgi:hypothetical protein
LLEVIPRTSHKLMLLVSVICLCGSWTRIRPICHSSV